MLLLVPIKRHRVLLVLRPAEGDDDVQVVLRAVGPDGAGLIGLVRELRDLDRPGIGQFIRMLVQDIPVQPMRHRLIVILRKELDDRRIRVLFQVVQGGGGGAGGKEAKRQRDAFIKADVFEVVVDHPSGMM